MKAETNFQALQQAANVANHPPQSSNPEVKKAAFKRPLKGLRIISKHYGLSEEDIVNTNQLSA